MADANSAVRTAEFAQTADFASAGEVLTRSAISHEVCHTATVALLLLESGALLHCLKNLHLIRTSKEAADLA